MSALQALHLLDQAAGLVRSFERDLQERLRDSQASLAAATARGEAAAEGVAAAQAALAQEEGRRRAAEEEVARLQRLLALRGQEREEDQRAATRAPDPRAATRSNSPTVQSPTVPPRAEGPDRPRPGDVVCLRPDNMVVSGLDLARAAADVRAVVLADDHADARSPSSPPLQVRLMDHPALGQVLSEGSSRVLWLYPAQVRPARPRRGDLVRFVEAPDREMAGPSTDQRLAVAWLAGSALLGVVAVPAATASSQSRVRVEAPNVPELQHFASEGGPGGTRIYTVWAWVSQTRVIAALTTASERSAAAAEPQAMRPVLQAASAGPTAPAPAPAPPPADPPAGRWTLLEVD